MYCRNCGTKLEDTDKHCPNCGEPVESKPTFVEVRRNDEPIEDVGSFGWVILGFFIPIAGLILFVFGIPASLNLLSRRELGH